MDDLISFALKRSGVRKLISSLGRSRFRLVLLGGSSLVLATRSLHRAFLDVLCGGEHDVDHAIQTRVLSWNKQTSDFSAGLGALRRLLQPDKLQKSFSADEPDVPSVPRATHLRFEVPGILSTDNDQHR